MVISDTKLATNSCFLHSYQDSQPNPVGKPFISGCECPTERISSFVDHLLQLIAKIQKSYLKDTTDFLNFIAKTKVAKDTIRVSMGVTSLYPNIPQEEGIETVCRTYETFYMETSSRFQRTSSEKC